MFFVQGHVVNIFKFVGHMKSVAITQQCGCMKAAISNVEMNKHAVFL